MRLGMPPTGDEEGRGHWKLCSQHLAAHLGEGLKIWEMRLALADSSIIFGDAEEKALRKAIELKGRN